MKNESHPKSAFTITNFAGMEVTSNGADAKSAPVRLVARTGQPINHPYWGKISHDLSGFSIPGGRNRIALDYVHDDREIVGYANRFDTETGDLVLSGALTPYRDGDRASEIAYKASQGVPYEASINWASDKTVLEQLGDGEETEVNGYTFTGPGTVVRRWELRSCAVCPSGADSGTSVELFSQDERVGVSVLEGCDMKTETKLAAPVDELEKTAAVEAEAVQAEAVEAPAEDDSVEATEPVVAEAAADEVAVEAPAAAQALTVDIEEGRRMADAFGARGALAFLEGKTFAETQAEVFAELQAENEKLRQQLESRSSGSSEPTQFSAPEGEQTKASKFPFRLSK